MQQRLSIVPPTEQQSFEASRAALSLKLLAEALNQRRPAGVHRLSSAREFVESLHLAESGDHLTSTLVTTKMVNVKGQSKEKLVWAGATGKYAVDEFLRRCPLELPPQLRTQAERFVRGIRKTRGDDRFEFVFGPSGTVDPHFSITEVSDYYMESVTKALPQLGSLRHVTFLLRTGRSSQFLCDHFFSGGADVEVYLQDPHAPFLTNAAVRNIAISIDTLKERWKACSKCRGSLTVYTSIAVATLRGIQIDDRFVALGWLIYERQQENSKRARVGRTAKKGGKEFRVQSESSLLPLLLVEKGHEAFDRVKAMFDGALSKIRGGTRRTPVVQLGVPNTEHLD